MKTYIFAVLMLFILEWVLFGEWFDEERRRSMSWPFVYLLGAVVFNLIAPPLIYGLFETIRDWHRQED